MMQTPALEKRIRKLTDPQSKRPNWRIAIDIGVVAALVAAIAGVFYKTVFGGQPISRLYQLGQRDSLFAQFFSPVREGYDASVYQYFVPNHVFTTKTIASGQLPLWNNLTGCGVPHLADIETAIFWPFRLLLCQLDPLQSWNLLIVANLALFVVGSYLLARTAGVGRIASTIAALAAALCPYIVFQSELIGGPFAFIPFVMTCFLKAADSESGWWKIAAGASCALMIISGHPEPAFFGILMSCIMFGLLVWPVRPGQDYGPIAVAQGIGTAGTFAFCLSAFAFLPFIELLVNSDCYKLGLAGWSFAVPFNSIFVNIIHPAYGPASPFLGICMPTLVAVAGVSLWRANPVVRALLITCLFAVILMVQVPPLNFLAATKAFSWFVPKYCWPTLVLMLSVLSGFGIDQLIKRWDDAVVRRTFVIGLGATAVLGAAVTFIPLLSEAPRIDEGMVKLVVSQKAFLKDLAILAAVFILIPVSMRVPKLSPWLAAITIAAATGASMLPTTKRAAPVQPAIRYADVQPVSYLAERGERIITMGRHVFVPDTNLAYDIANMVPVNVYHPKGFQQFAAESGITNEGVNQFFDGRLSPFVNLASVKYVVSPNPVISTSERPVQTPALDDSEEASWSAAGGAQTRMIAAALRYYPHNSEIIGRARFEVPAAVSKNLAIQPVLLDDDEKVIWFGDLERLEYQFQAPSVQETTKTIDRDIFAAVPYGIQPGTMLTMAIQVFDYSTNLYLPVTPRAFKDVDRQSLFKLATFTREGQLISSDVPFVTGQPSDRQFRLVLETPGKARIYENTGALPQAYVVHSVVPVESPTAAMDALSSPIFKPHDVAVIECVTPPIKPAPAGSLSSLNEQNRIACTRPDPNTVVVKCKVAREGMLVLTDTYYPGWVATITTHSATARLPIYRANYLFRAVPVPAGEFTVEFKYVPMSMYIGIGLSIIALALIGFLAYIEAQGLSLEQLTARFRRTR